MAEVLDDSLKGFVQDRCKLHNAPYEKLETAEFLFNISEVIINSTSSEADTFKFPFSGKTPFYQTPKPDVLIVDRLATPEITVMPYHGIDFFDDEFIEGEISLKLAIDLRSQYKRNRLPLPLSFGKLALSSTCYKDKVLRIIEGDINEIRPNSLNSYQDLLISHLNVYGVGPECRSADDKIIAMAKKIEEISRLLGAHDLVLQMIEEQK